MTTSPKVKKGNYFSIPARATYLSEWVLLPLRLFVGVTFLFAGLQKLSNPNFFNPKSPISIQAQLQGATHTSPLHALLVHMLSWASLIGHVVAFGELAIGLGILVGLLTRIAAIGGALLSFSLFLAVSFHSSPYFTGADIVFFFAFLPLIVSSTPPKLSVDGALRYYAAAKSSLPPTDVVAVEFATVQRLCGNFSDGSCAARGGRNCESGACPVLHADVPVATPVQIASVERRTMVLASTAAGTAALGTLILGSTVGALGKLIGGAPAPTNTTLAPTTTTSAATATSTTASSTTTTTAVSTTEATTTTVAKTAGTLLGAASEVPVGRAASISLPSGDPGIVIHVSDSEWKCYDAVCPHAGCTVGYASSMLVCPCHGSEFKVSNGAVIAGPAQQGLKEFPIVESTNGNLYLQ